MFYFIIDLILAGHP